MAADAEPLEILLHLPLLCEDKVTLVPTNRCYVEVSCNICNNWNPLPRKQLCIFIVCLCLHLVCSLICLSWSSSFSKWFVCIKNLFPYFFQLYPLFYRICSINVVFYFRTFHMCLYVPSKHWGGPLVYQDQSLHVASQWMRDHSWKVRFSQSNLPLRNSLFKKAHFYCITFLSFHKQI